MTTRRHFISLVPAAGLALQAGRVAAQAKPVDPKDPQAAALGYVADAAQADKAKYPKFAAGQACGSCQLYAGAAGAATGACPLFAGKVVAAKGWCSAWAKKA
ncbi:high-potential iron-sulfur protein [Piscinibacter sakaiensis]|uniref:High-potential iron-sulfur protein n=1 Tax=Piscinibacter sakaiensis TaxID=1547922 RepID=A0A0K8NVJ2_PISS1|nr:high-potential iron-sulfur protein [Piscinibacter sakaiensis]GAP34398.1 high potential iron-sulfur protein [Piscinibacter sakaiensis]